VVGHTKQTPPAPGPGGADGASSVDAA
jgi:hypothetical protein